MAIRLFSCATSARICCIPAPEVAAGVGTGVDAGVDGRIVVPLPPPPPPPIKPTGAPPPPPLLEEEEDEEEPHVVEVGVTVIVVVASPEGTVIVKLEPDESHAFAVRYAVLE